MKQPDKPKPKPPKVVREYFAELGRRSKGGGRPLKPENELTPEQLKRRRRYLKRNESIF